MAEMAVEDELATLLGPLMDTLDHITTDYYDNSIELFFTPETAHDFTLSQEQRDGIAAMGFAGGWCNFTDGTECSFGKDHPGQRKAVSNPRWTLERYKRENP